MKINAIDGNSRQNNFKANLTISNTVTNIKMTTSDFVKIQESFAERTKEIAGDMFLSLSGGEGVNHRISLQFKNGAYEDYYTFCQSPIELIHPKTIKGFTSMLINVLNLFKEREAIDANIQGLSARLNRALNEASNITGRMGKVLSVDGWFAQNAESKY